MSTRSWRALTTSSPACSATASNRQELEKAKTGYLQQFQVQRTRDAGLAGSLAENLYLGRTMQFQADLEEKIRTLTPQAVDAASGRTSRSQASLGGDSGRFREKGEN